MTGRKATLDAQVDGRAARDIRMFLAGRFSEDGASRQLHVKLNDRILGIAQPTGTDGLFAAEFQVPRSVFNKFHPVAISFEGDAADGGFELSSVKLSDDKIGGFEYQGFVDGCSRTQVSGWARDGPSPTPINILVAGRVIANIAPNIRRPDLESAGLPADAGFRYFPSAAFAAGDEITVTFENGVPLSRSPCIVR